MVKARLEKTSENRPFRLDELMSELSRPKQGLLSVWSAVHSGKPPVMFVDACWPPRRLLTNYNPRHYSLAQDDGTRASARSSIPCLNGDPSLLYLHLLLLRTVYVGKNKTAFACEVSGMEKTVRAMSGLPVLVDSPGSPGHFYATTAY